MLQKDKILPLAVFEPETVKIVDEAGNGDAETGNR